MTAGDHLGRDKDAGDVGVGSQPFRNHRLSSARWAGKNHAAGVCEAQFLQLRHGFLKRDDVVPQGLLDGRVPSEEVVDVRIAFDEVVLQIKEGALEWPVLIEILFQTVEETVEVVPFSVH